MNNTTLKNILSNKDKTKYHFHFVGIGGVSMYGLAIFLFELGHKISGSDTQYSQNVKNLIKMGINVENRHKKTNVVGANFVIYSYAVENNIEVKEAKRQKIKRTKIFPSFVILSHTSDFLRGIIIM